MYKKAAQRKLRFAHKGQIGTEDLWDLNVQQLDSIYKKLAKEQKETEEESLLSRGPGTFSIVGLKIGIVKDVVNTKLADAAAATDRAAQKAKRERIKSIIVEKQDQGLKDMSLEDLQKALDETE